jgi:hypothetical protein
MAERGRGPYSQLSSQTFYNCANTEVALKKSLREEWPRIREDFKAYCVTINNNYQPYERLEQCLEGSAVRETLHQM